MIEKDDVDNSALDAIKDAHRHPRPLTRDEIVEFLERRVYMGFPAVFQRYKGRGRKPTLTQYGLAYKRRRRLYRDLVKLPKLRIGSHTVKPEVIVEIARQEEKPHKRVRAVMLQLGLQGGPVPNETTIRRILRKNRL